MQDLTFALPVSLFAGSVLQVKGGVTFVQPVGSVSTSRKEAEARHKLQQVSYLLLNDAPPLTVVLAWLSAVAPAHAHGASVYMIILLYTVQPVIHIHIIPISFLLYYI